MVKSSRDTDIIFNERCTSFNVSQRADSIVIVELLDHDEIDVPQVEELLALLNRQFGDKRLPTIILLPEFTNMSKEALLLSGSEKGTRNSLHEAVVVKSVANRIIFRMYYVFVKPPVPTTYHSSFEEAVEKLKQVMLENGR
jgi:hypothetical protein